VEAVDVVDVVAVDASGRELLGDGDPDRPLFYRSAIKPIQAATAVEHGAALPPEHIAMAASSHGGFPVHTATVAAMLDAAGLDERRLGCPPAWPAVPEARDLAVRRGEPRPRRLFHNCSGKHAAWLRACVASGWSLDGYLDPDHPLQRAIVGVVHDVTGVDPEPVGVDGCGAPTLRGTPRGLARAFARLTADARFGEVARAVGAYPALVADGHRPHGRFGMWWGGPAKAGAMGLFGAGRNGVGLAARSRSGQSWAAVVALAEAARRLGLLTDAMWHGLADVVRPPVVGGGRPVGITTVELA